jgi:GcrA cell cycle regulator
MQQTDWAPAHCDALREYLAKGMSYAQVADAINAKFGTGYSRNAAISRARRMGLVSPAVAGRRPKRPPRTSAERLGKAQERHVPEPPRPVPEIERAELPALRCVEIVPRHLAVTDLEDGDCRYPYGGDADGEAITFCGHPRRAGSSYCTPHFFLTRGPGTASERTAVAVLLRLVSAA